MLPNEHSPDLNTFRVTPSTEAITSTNPRRAGARQHGWPGCGGDHYRLRLDPSGVQVSGTRSVSSPCLSSSCWSLVTPSEFLMPLRSQALPNHPNNSIPRSDPPDDSHTLHLLRCTHLLDQAALPGSRLESWTAWTSELGGLGWWWAATRT